MERLSSLYKTEEITIVASGEEHLLLLLNDRHVKHEKADLKFLNCFKLKTDIEEPIPHDIAKLVRTKYIPFYSSDIEKIITEEDHFKIILHSNLTIHFGEFLIYKEQ